MADSSTSEIARPLLLHTALHITNIRNIVTNLRESASSISAEIIALSQVEELQSVDWPTRRTRLATRLEHTRRVLDTMHPSSVVEDVLLKCVEPFKLDRLLRCSIVSFLFSLPLQTDIVKWLKTRQLLVHTGTTSAMLPREFHDWIEFFEQRTRIADEFGAVSSSSCRRQASGRLIQCSEANQSQQTRTILSGL